MSILEKILKDLYVEPELLAELDEEQKQLLFCKMREEQVRRWLCHEQQLASGQSGRPRSQSRVRWLLDDNGEPWVWVMGEEADGKVTTVDQAIQHRLKTLETTASANGHCATDGPPKTTNMNAEEQSVLLEQVDWQLDVPETNNPPKGVAKIPVSEEVLLDVERQIRLMARRAREQHWLDNLSAESRLRASAKCERTGCGSQSPSKASIVDWYKREEFARRAGLEDGRFACWFHGLLSRPEAEDLLASRSIGAFLVRISEKICGYVLSYQAGYKIKHFMILSVHDGYHFIGSNQTIYATLNSLVAHHTAFPITEAGMELLTDAVGQSKSPPDYAELLDLFQ